MSNNLPQFAQAQTEEIPADESALVENLSREIVDRRLTIPDDGLKYYVADVSHLRLRESVFRLLIRY